MRAEERVSAGSTSTPGEDSGRTAGRRRATSLGLQAPSLRGRRQVRLMDASPLRSHHLVTSPSDERRGDHSHSPSLCSVEAIEASDTSFMQESPQLALTARDRLTGNPVAVDRLRQAGQLLWHVASAVRGSAGTEDFSGTSPRMGASSRAASLLGSLRHLEDFVLPERAAESCSSVPGFIGRLTRRVALLRLFRATVEAAHVVLAATVRAPDPVAPGH